MRTVRRPTAAVALRIAVASGLFLSPVWADDWPVYLGPRQDNTSEEEGLLTTWPEGGPPRVWSKTLGASFAPPVNVPVNVLPDAAPSGRLACRASDR